jgi:hypothetical protein
MVESKLPSIVLRGKFGGVPLDRSKRHLKFMGRTQILLAIATVRLNGSLLDRPHAHFEVTALRPPQDEAIFFLPPSIFPC